MPEEHVEQHMVEHKPTRIAESEDEGPLAKVGRQRNAGIRRMGIELPPLNTTLIEVHRELAKVNMGTKDMVIKNKNVLKTINPNYRRLKNTSRS